MRILRACLLVPLVLAACDSEPSFLDVRNEVQRVDVSGIPAEAGVSDTLHLKAVVIGRGGQPLQLGADGVRWESAQPSAVSFKVTGPATADVVLLEGGPVVLRATYKSVVQSSTVQVHDSSVVTFNVPSVVLTRRGSVQPFVVTVAHRREAAALEVIEQRVISDWPVIDMAKLARGEIVSDGPGRAIVIARAPHSAPDTLTVAVQYTEPVVRDMAGAAARVGTGDTLWLRGFHLDRLPADSILVDGVTATRLVTQPTRIGLAIATLETCSGSVKTSVLVRGSMPAAFTVSRKHSNEIELGRYEPHSLSANEVRCLRLPPGTNSRPARYALLYAHTDLIARAQTRSSYFARDSVHVTLTDLTDGDVSTQIAVPPASYVTSAATIPEVVPQRTTPYNVGDTIRLAYDIRGPQDPLYRVAKIYGGRYVVMAPVHADTAFVRVEQQIDSAMKVMAGLVIPFYREALWDNEPRSSNAVPQFAIAIRPYNAPGFGDLARVHPNSFVIQIEFSNPQTEHWVGALAHGLAWVWHWNSQGEDWQTVGSYEEWNAKGVTTFMHDEVLRRYHGFGFTQNVAPIGYNNTGGRYPNSELNAQPHNFIFGSHTVASYLRDLVWTLMREGVSQESAFQMVLRGAAKGWYGCAPGPENNCSEIGLVEVMRARFGPAWDPGESLTDWLAAKILDEVGPPGRFQLPSVRMPSYLGDQYAPFRPARVLRGGNGGDAVGHFNGAVSFVELQADERGAAFKAEMGGQMSWKIIRID